MSASAAAAATAATAAATVQLAIPGEYLPQSSWLHSSPYGDADDDVYTDKVGGTAVWSRDALAPPPAADALRCRLCNTSLLLITQLYVPSSAESDAEKVLYVFGCNRAACALCGESGWLKAVRITLSGGSGSSSSSSGGSVDSSREQ